jgi:hypothetical protein
MSDTIDQMGLFDLSRDNNKISNELISKSNIPKKDFVSQSEPTKNKKALPVKLNKSQAHAVKQTTKTKSDIKTVSGLVPDGDVRLTANIRQDLHLKLKIAAAHRRTTIGEIIEELVSKYI